MLAKIFVALTAFTAVLAVPTGGSTTIVNNNVCQGGNIHCCNTAQSAQNQATALISGLLGGLLGGLTGQVSVGCSPITVLGLGGGSSCTQTTFCCQDNSASGLIVVSCSPVIL